MSCDSTNVIIKALVDSDFKDWKQLQSFEFISYSDTQQYWLDHQDVMVLLEMMPQTVSECRIHSQDEIHDARQLVSFTNRFNFLELGYNRVF